MHRSGQAERRRVVDLDLRQAAYDASLAGRRYAACDPDNRLIAFEFKKNWPTREELGGSTTPRGDLSGASRRAAGARSHRTLCPILIGPTSTGPPQTSPSRGLRRASPDSS